MDKIYALLRTSGETVEKVPKLILGGDAEKNDFTECATINDLTIMKGRETPKNQALTVLKGFSTFSAEIDLSEKGGLVLTQLTKKERVLAAFTLNSRD